MHMIKIKIHKTGADPGFQVRGGALKKIEPSRGRREHFWGISSEKSRIYAKKSYFFQLRREARKCVGYFVWKITISRQKIIFLPILGGARAGCASPWIRPCKKSVQNNNYGMVFLSMPHYQSVTCNLPFIVTIVCCQQSRCSSEYIFFWRQSTIIERLY